MSPAMASTPGLAIGLAWAAWIVSWFAAAVWSRNTAARPPFGAQLPDRIVTIIGGVILFHSLGGAASYFPDLWPYSPIFGWAMLACVLAGMAFTWWARLHLGTLWSANITRKSDHRIVDTGPYRIVRHPIYTGLIFALFATALQRGRVEPLIGAALMALGFWLKARLEERFLAPTLPEYAHYRARVPMLIPGLKGSA